MKRIIIVLLALLPMMASAQVKFASVDYDTVLKQMPEYAKAQQDLAELKGKYDQEATRGEEEFQKKFSEFLQGQKDFPENILVKRQAELQTLMEAGIKFRQEAQELLSKAEQDLIASVKAKLNEAIRTVGLEGGYAFVVNSEKDACPFINPLLGENITDRILKQLGIEASTTEAAPADANVQ